MGAIISNWKGNFFVGGRRRQKPRELKVKTRISKKKVSPLVKFPITCRGTERKNARGGESRTFFATKSRDWGNLQEAKGQMVGIKSVKCRTGTEDTPGIFCSSRFGTRKWNIPNHALLTGKFGGEKRGEMWITQKNAVKSKEKPFV